MLARDKTRREIKPPNRYGYENLIAASEVLEDEPTSVKTALASKENEKWKVDVQEKMKSLSDNNTWDLIKRPIGSRVANCKWIFKRKEGIKGVVPDRFKAILVA